MKEVTKGLKINCKLETISLRVLKNSDTLGKVVVLDDTHIHQIDTVEGTLESSEHSIEQKIIDFEFFGEDHDSLLTLGLSGSLVKVNLETLEVEAEAKISSSKKTKYMCFSLAICPQNRFACVTMRVKGSSSYSMKTNNTTKVAVLEIDEDEIKRRSTCGIKRPKTYATSRYFSDLICYGYVSDFVIFLAFSQNPKADAFVLAFDVNEGKLKELEDLRVSSGAKHPLKVAKFEDSVYILGKELKLHELNLI